MLRHFRRQCFGAKKRGPAKKPCVPANTLPASATSKNQKPRLYFLNTTCAQLRAEPNTHLCWASGALSTLDVEGEWSHLFPGRALWLKKDRWRRRGGKYQVQQFSTGGSEAVWPEVAVYSQNGASILLDNSFAFLLLLKVLSTCVFINFGFQNLLKNIWNMAYF